MKTDLKLTTVPIQLKCIVYELPGYHIFIITLFYRLCYGSAAVSNALQSLVYHEHMKLLKINCKSITHSLSRSSVISPALI